MLDEENIHLFNRAYCYLRLSGFSAKETFFHLQNLPVTLFLTDSDIWTTLIHKLSRQSKDTNSVDFQPPPPIIRGHMRYPEHTSKS